MTSGMSWESKSKDLLKSLIEKRIRSIIGISMENIEKLSDGNKSFADVRCAILKLCNDMVRKLHADVDDFTVKKNLYTYDMPYVDREG